MPLSRSLEAPDEHCQFTERSAEFAGRRLLLQQDRPYRRKFLIARKALVVPGNRRRETARKVSALKTNEATMLHHIQKNIILRFFRIFKYNTIFKSIFFSLNDLIQVFNDTNKVRQYLTFFFLIQGDIQGI